MGLQRRIGRVCICVYMRVDVSMRSHLCSSFATALAGYSHLVSEGHDSITLRVDSNKDKDGVREVENNIAIGWVPGSNSSTTASFAAE